MGKNCSAILVVLFVIGVGGTAFILNTDLGVAQPTVTQTPKSNDWCKWITSIATLIAVILAAIALWVNYILNRRRVAFDSLLKLAEFFHIQLKEDRDNVVDLEIKDDSALKAFLAKVQAKDEKAIKESRALIRVLNFYALMAIMIQDKYLRGDVVEKYFGASICHKATDWTSYIDYLNTDENYKEMISQVKYICELAGTSRILKQARN